MSSIRRAIYRWSGSRLRSWVCPWRFGVDKRVGELQFWFRNLQNSTIEKFGEMVQKNEDRADTDLDNMRRKIENAVSLLEGKIRVKANEETVAGIIRHVDQLSRRVNILETDGIPTKPKPDRKAAEDIFGDCPKMTDSERGMHRTPEDDVCYQVQGTTLTASDFSPGIYRIQWRGDKSQIAMVTIDGDTGRKMLQCCDWQEPKWLADFLMHIIDFEVLEVAEKLASA